MEEQSGVTQMFMKTYNSECTGQIIGNLYSSISLIKNYSTISPEEWSAIKSKQTGYQTQCWRQCGQLTADRTHIFLTCPTLQPFWTEVQATTKIVPGDIDFTCLPFYLGNISKDLHNRGRYLLKILVAASKKASK